jgi:hypothetical protein
LVCLQRRDADHDIADLLAGLDVPVGLDDLVQRIPPVDDRCRVPQTAVTVAPRLLASWTAAEPMAPVAPLTSTSWPLRSAGRATSITWTTSGGPYLV